MDLKYLRQLPDGTWLDTRFKYARGDNVRIVQGPLRGRIATVENRVAQLRIGDQLVSVPGYHLSLADGKLVTVQWDWVKPVEG